MTDERENDERDLRAYYGPVEVPPCRLCGAPLTIGFIGDGKATKYACSAADFKNMGKDWLDHYSKSGWTDYRRGGDERVIAVLDALAEARALLASLRPVVVAAVSESIAERLHNPDGTWPPGTVETLASMRMQRARAVDALPAAAREWAKE